MTPRRFQRLAIPAVLLCALLPPCPGGETAPVEQAPLAFPGAQGFGAHATGGRGGTVYHVTTLADDGPGSFRDAVSQGGRTVVFDVGGTVRLRSILAVHSDITIDGRTAPGEGVTLLGQEVSFSDAHNVIVRSLRVRQGPDGGARKSAVGIHAGSDMIFEHCSIEWGRWDCVDMNDSRDITFQDCLIGAGIAPQRFGCLCGSDDVTFLRCLFIHNQSRSPKAKGRVQYVNNVVYDWGVTGFVGGHSAADHWADLVNNVFVKGPSSNDRFVGEFTATDHVYQSGNVADLDRDGRLNGRPVTAADFGTATLVPRPFAPPLAGVLSAADAYAAVAAGAGCSAHRDAVDTRLIADLKSLGTRGSVAPAGRSPAEK